MSQYVKGGSLNWAEPKENVAWNENFCIQCGKKVGADPYWVQVINGGEIREQDGSEADYNDAGYMGYFAVGNECAKKFAKNILFKFKEMGKL
jgi:hypothetical protein